MYIVFIWTRNKFFYSVEYVYYKLAVRQISFTKTDSAKWERISHIFAYTLIYEWLRAASHQQKASQWRLYKYQDKWKK